MIGGDGSLFQIILVLLQQILSIVVGSCVVQRTSHRILRHYTFVLHLAVLHDLTAVHQEHALQDVTQIRREIRLQLICHTGYANEQTMNEILG